ncbi:hypothetical protein Pcac1_g12225 [Phytophthora cactorum]|uniref:Uncharacterized protein n=2 Tax=Phytophthora cactorum TaxID=29920 RepID=A0A8T1AW61_9STRA|nr:hypothetical protein Pcac1_g12225 [Phytophthora cactorum]KAG2891563.1 hypothetical protein PC117_g24206 [Phytophthora cactorum]KAG3025430.1 hypothetical protein PC119_g8153 [Phytophthora cactorum]
MQVRQHIIGQYVFFSPFNWLKIHDEMAASEAALSFVDEFADGRAAPVPTQPLEVLSKQEMEWALGFPSSSKDSPRSSSPSASPQPNSENHHTTTDEDGSPRRVEHEKPKRTRAPRR